jgi:predicted nucleotidyltransferase
MDLIWRRKESNRVYYRAKTENPLYPEIRNLVLKTSGLADVLRVALRDERIRIAFVFGSVAAGEEKAGSDIDLMVIGNLGLRDLSRLLFGVTDKVGREINPHVVNEKEFRRRIKSSDHFLSTIMREPKIFITGSKNELEAMGK